MTPEQYDRWKDFALRMARTCWQGRTRPSTEWVVENVEQFFEVMFDSAKSAATVQSWDSAPDYVCDRMSDFVYDHEERIGYWRIKNSDEERVEKYEARLVAQGLDDADIDAKVRAFEDKLEETFDKREDMAFDRWDEQWMGPVRCCIRAGLDMASEPSAGVIGFTVGDLRRMYPEGLPAWLTEGWENGDLNSAPDGAGVWL